MKFFKRNKGITLVALVVTIVIMLILAGVTLNIALGDNGIIKQAQKAADKTSESLENDTEQMEKIVDIINGYLEVPNTVEEAIEINYKFKENTDIIDKYGNTVTIPAGFRIVPNGTDSVEYNYDENKNGDKSHIPTVQDGIVVTDEDGNQFVWIPVGTGDKAIKNKENDNNGLTTEIKLARRTFGEGGSITKELTDETIIENNYTENTKTNNGKSEYGNAIAKDIIAFKTSVEKNRGYYLARYEAGVTNYDENNIKNENSNNSTNWTGYTNADGKVLQVVSKKNQQVWNYITQNKASEIAQKMYEGKEENYTSDLVNSYAWDTAMVFIQKYSKEDDYSQENGKHFSSNLRSTGAGKGTDGDKIDKVCNIYDMASNYLEWETESSNWREPERNRCCAIRGGYFYNENPCGQRYAYWTTKVGVDISFRCVLYINK